MVKWCSSVLLIGSVYFIAGRFGQYLAAPPIYATAVWPASGIALAGLLLLGMRVWPGLFLGALAVNSWSALVTPDNSADIVQALLVATGMSVGATLQAVVAAWLIHRLVGFPNALNRERDILVFLGLGGPLACTIGATFGVGSLVAAGNCTWSQAPLQWWTWWVGDVIGVIIFVPMTLVLFARPRQIWRSRRLSVAVPLCVTLVAVAIAFTYTHISEQRQTNLKFERRASNVFQTLKENVDRYLDVVHSMRSFYASSVDVTRDEFDVFHRNLLSRHNGIQALEWIPRVPREQKERYETLARDDGFVDFQITERADDGTLTPAGDRTEYFPVFFVVPHQGNENAFGYDLGSDPIRRRALMAARDTGNQIATAPITLVQESKQEGSILVIVPVYANNVSTQTQHQRREHLRGFLLAALRVVDMIEAAQPSLDTEQVDLRIADVSEREKVLYSSGGKTIRSKASESLAILAEEIRWSADLPVAGRNWKFDFVPNDKFFASSANENIWFVLAGGLSFTSLLTVFLMIMSGRATQVEDLVEERTEELSNANLELEREITSRQEFEEALSRAHEELEHRVEERTADLKASEARYQDLYDHAPDMFISVDVATKQLIECNRTLLAVTGFQKSELVGRSIFDIYHADSLATARASFDSFLDTGSVKDIELNLLRKNQEPLAVSMNVSAVRDEQGDLMYSRAALRDISEKRQAEARIKHHEAELAHVARLSTMGEMAAGLAHEINQPLAAIAAYADGVAVRLKNGAIETDQLKAVVGNIASDAHRAGEVIRRLRRFVRNREPDRTPVDVNSLVLDVAQFVASDATQRQIQVHLKLAEQLPLALTDAIEFQQVLLNLVRNGFDAMTDTPSVDRSLTIRSETSGKMIEISVEDQGHGLPSETTEQVFEAFFTSKEDGLGMGLAISRSIVESHGGRIWATPTSSGATFHFTLPISTESPTPHIE